MQTLADIEREAMRLPDRDRACLASRLLESRPAVLSDDDDGLAEAIRCSAEMDKDPGAARTLEEVGRSAKLL
jgi:hypothetical protein